MSTINRLYPLAAAIMSLLLKPEASINDVMMQIIDIVVVGIALA